MAISTPPAKAQAGDVKDTIKNLYATKKYSDLGIYCRGKFWDVHQAIVCMRSDVLETLCVKAGRQSLGKLHLDLSDYESEIVSCVLDFAYLDHYEYSGNDGILFHTKMFIAANKFGILGLQEMAVLEYQKAVEGVFEKGVFEKSFCDAAALVWAQLSGDGDGKALKDVVVRIARERIELLLESEGGEFRKLGLQRPEIGMAVLEAVVGHKSPGVVEVVGEAVGVLEESPLTSGASDVSTTDIERVGEVVVELRETPSPLDPWPQWAAPTPKEKTKAQDSADRVQQPIEPADDSWSLGTGRNGKAIPCVEEVVEKTELVLDEPEPVHEPEIQSEVNGIGIGGKKIKVKKDKVKKVKVKKSKSEPLAPPDFQEGS